MQPELKKELFATPFEGGARASLDALATGAAQPGAYIPLTIGGGGLAYNTAQEALKKMFLLEIWQQKMKEE